MRRMPFLGVVAVAMTGLMVAVLFGLSPANATQRPRVAFEVAAIRPTLPSSSSGGVRMDGAQLHMAGFPFREYVARAYRIRVSHVIGPDWMASDRFDVDAKLPEGVGTDRVAEMLQALLSDRFALKQHREQREMDAYALIRSDGALKLTESPADPKATPRNDALVNVTVAVVADGVSVDLGNGSTYILETGGRFVGRRLTAEMIASTLERYCDRRVVNMTGLTGTYDLMFQVSPEESAVLGIRAAVHAGVRLPPGTTAILDTGGNPLISAVQQLGLKLEARRAPVDVLVVDEVRRTPTEN
jgi:uncharacterized protein (TIGR03435 family)